MSLYKLLPPYVIEVSEIWGDVKGIAFIIFIFVTDKSNESLVSHERIHIRQQWKEFIVLFFIKYLYYRYRYGYRGNPYEVEAYKNQLNN